MEHDSKYREALRGCELCREFWITSGILCYYHALTIRWGDDKEDAFKIEWDGAY